MYPIHTRTSIRTSQNLWNLHADCQLHAQLCLAYPGRPTELGYAPSGDALAVVA